jgi:D-glycero-alpha-D-manno-heptose-7-phosphate kinase
MPTKHQLAMEGIYIEQNMVRETVGSQDQALAAYGGFNHIQFLQNGEISARPVILAAERLREINAHLMLFYTGIKRTAAQVAESYVLDIESKKRQLRIMKDLVDEALSLINGGGDLTGFGELMHEGWMAKRSLSSAVANREVDGIYEAARKAGATGGKITGAGGGGFLVLFVPPACQGAVRETLRTLIHVPFAFDYSGSQIIYFQHEEDYAQIEADTRRCRIAPFRELEAVALK